MEINQTLPNSTRNSLEHLSHQIQVYTPLKTLSKVVLAIATLVAATVLIYGFFKQRARKHLIAAAEE